MISETERGTLIASLHNIDFNWDESQLTPIPLQPKILRFMEDVEREEDFIVIEFRPTSVKHGLSYNMHSKRRTNEVYRDFAYGEEEMVSIVVMARTKTYVNGRVLAQDWLRRIEQYIRLNWNNLTLARIVNNSFTPYMEEQNFFAGRQYIYRMDFTMVSPHGWSNEPVENTRPAPEVIGVDVEDILVWVESE